MLPGWGLMTWDDSEFSDLFVSQYPSIVRATYLVVHDLERAEDLAQEAFIELLRKWDRVVRLDRPGAWVRRVAIRKAMRSARREARRRPLERRASETTSRNSAAADAPAIELLEEVRNLPPKQRAAIALFYFYDLPAEEVALALGCSESTARVHLHRARRSLKNTMTRTEQSR